jgi:Cu-Zn family superoxide dismutase
MDRLRTGICGLVGYPVRALEIPMRPLSLFAYAGALAVALLTSCGGPRQADAAPAPTTAIAVVVPTKDSSVHGVVHFTQQGDALLVVADIEGLAPTSTHGFHVHEFGDASAADGTSAGTHYNPEGHHHGGPQSQEHHAGDLGNIVADAAGKAHFELTTTDLTIAGAHNPILGRSVIVHANADDFTANPNVGARIAIGVIGLAKPTAPPAK